MMMRTPVWDDKNIKWAALNEGDEWTQSAYVVIPELVTREVLHRAYERMGNVQHLYVPAMVGEDYLSIFELLKKSAMPNLRSFSVERPVMADEHIALAKALLNKPQLQQLKVFLVSDLSVKRWQRLFEAFDSLPLTALNLQLVCVTLDPQPVVLKLCQLLQSKKHTLVSLELSNSDGLFDETVINALDGLRLRVLRLRCDDLNEQLTQKLCKLLNGMPHLQNLSIAVDRVAALTEFFSSAFRPLKVLEYISRAKVADSELVHLFEALRKNTKLQMLKLSVRREYAHCILQSGLLDEGLLTEICETNMRQVADSGKLRPLLRRNKSRHDACKRACIALLAARKTRGALKWIAVDVIRMIAMWLWDTRNQSAWDVQVATAKKMKNE